MSSLRGVALPLAFLLVHLPALSGQAVLAGTVRQDSGGRPLAGVEVIPEGTNRRTTTDATGRFVLGGLPFGPRAVLFRMVGFRPVRQGVILLRGDTVRVDVTLGQRGSAGAAAGRSRHPARAAGYGTARGV
ncbi:MAG: carboxypeptidase-like regulatory domain-containing protein [Gemmatimonadales bacterium]